jgi:hypothetical protein
MSMRSLTTAAALISAFAVVPLAAAAETSKAPHLGISMSKDDIARWDLTIFPDGRGLPPGRGTAKEGHAIYAERCASCHGANGEGATAEELIGEPKPPSPENPSKAIGSYWPYPTTVFDFIRRSMPPGAPGSLSADQIYAVTAYLLAASKIIADNDEMNAETLPKIKMPNRDGFIWIDVKK